MYMTFVLDLINYRLVLSSVFIGYSRTQKGYRCYDPQTRRQVISADVTFFEHTPYYPVPYPDPPVPGLNPGSWFAFLSRP